MGGKGFFDRQGEAVLSEGALGATEDNTARSSRPQRWSAKRKKEAVLRLLRGEDLETLSRELGVGACRLSSWREDFLAGGEAQLKARRSLARDRKVRELQRKLGELTMENELLREKARRLEGRAVDFPWRRSKR